MRVLILGSKGRMSTSGWDWRPARAGPVSGRWNAPDHGGRETGRQGDRVIAEERPAVREIKGTKVRLHAAGMAGHARRIIACTFVPALAALLMQCAPGPPLLAQLPAAQTSVFKDCADCPEMVALPEADVALGRFEVTVEEWRSFALAVPDAAEARCSPRDWRVRDWQNTGYIQTARHPVVCVSWNEAQAYAEWLSLETGHPYRLPTDAEWNRGAAGSGKGCRRDGGFDSTEWGTCVVGSFSTPTEAGLYDMEGNVAEWTDSCWARDCRRKLVRGTWFSNPGRTWGRGARRDERRDARRGLFPTTGRTWLGFRVARTLP